MSCSLGSLTFLIASALLVGRAVAYDSAIRLAGETTAILNIHGYSYMLRGDLGSARRAFLKAL
jgi:Flp pilus assembly protein TadD